MEKLKDGSTRYNTRELEPVTVSELITLLQKIEPEHGNKTAELEGTSMAQLCRGVDIRDDGETIALLHNDIGGTYTDYGGWKNRVEL